MLAMTVIGGQAGGAQSGIFTGKIGERCGRQLSRDIFNSLIGGLATDNIIGHPRNDEAFRTLHSR